MSLSTEYYILLLDDKTNSLHDLERPELEARAIDVHSNTVDILKTFATSLMGTFYLNIITKRMHDSNFFTVVKRTYKYFIITPNKENFKSLLESKITGLQIKGDLLP